MVSILRGFLPLINQPAHRVGRVPKAVHRAVGYAGENESTDLHQAAARVWHTLQVPGVGSTAAAFAASERPAALRPVRVAVVRAEKLLRALSRRVHQCGQLYRLDSG